ncbi:MAG: transglycosylase SLT domain-containing protein [Cellvibrionaceae bacterium]|nr:transglycosylase SLT domain-containing protein [Cellvibrionaceae bacterium]
MFQEVGEKYNIDPLLLYAIAITESATGVGKGYIQPSPYVFRTASGPQFFSSRTEAEHKLSPILLKTQHVDIGMMQINLHYHPQPNPLELLDPYYNLSVAAEYLQRTLNSTTDPIIGVGRYHSWTEELAKWYGNRVWKTYSNLLKIFTFNNQ